MQLSKLLILIMLAAFSHANASSLFEDDTVLEISLSGPLSSLFKDLDESSEMPFLLRVNDAEHSIKVRARGKSRKRVCDFPPLRLNFVVGETTQSIFDGQDKLKLVSHCKENDAARVNTLQEYAAYRMLNLTSDVSYKVRLLRITYTDTDGRLKESSFERYGFVIESASELADRVGGQPVDVPGISLKSLDSRQAATVYIFQYLIGNTDWSLVTAAEDESCCHNGDLFDIGSNRYYVPYDFDQSGLVNARYARPDPSLRISRVTKRLYRGFCMPTDALKDALSAITVQRVDILDEITQLPGLSEKEIERTAKYLDQFFDQAKNVDKMVQSFERKCL